MCCVCVLGQRGGPGNACNAPLSFVKVSDIVASVISHVACVVRHGRTGGSVRVGGIELWNDAPKMCQ